MLSSASHASRAAPLLVCGLLALSFATLVFAVQRHGPELRAAAEAQRTKEIDRENKAFCRRFGIDPGTARYAECAQGLLEIRKRHEQRVTTDLVGIL
jgi:hypothetical protein